MHTDEIKDAEGNEWAIHHSAYADEGEIIVTRHLGIPVGANTAVEYEEHRLPVEIFIEFVGRKMMSDHIEKLEQMTGKQVLEMLNDG